MSSNLQNEPLADFKLLAEELDEDCARELAGCFLEDTAVELAGVDEAIGAKDAEKLKAHAHGLKGACRTIKAARSEQTASDLEMAAISNDWSAVASQRSQFQKDYDELCEYVKTYLAG